MVTKKLNALGAFEDLELFDKEGNKVYSFVVHSDDSWEKTTWDKEGNKLTSENSDGDWCKFTYDSNGNLLTHENSNGYWYKRTYDSDGKELTFEDSYGKKMRFDIFNLQWSNL
jgi:YD repeat-containing protein